MSFLILEDGIPDFHQAVISFWFRVPQASIDAAVADITYEGFGPGRNYDVPLQGIVPFITFGTSMPVSFDDYANGVHWGTSETGPGYVGLKVYPDGSHSLIARVQSTYYNPASWPPVGHGGAAIGNQPGTGDFFAVGDYPHYAKGLGGFVNEGPIQPAADKWHHLLISMDLGRTISYRSDSEGSLLSTGFSDACKWQWSYDGENQGDETLYPWGLATLNYADGPYSGEPDLIASAYFITSFDIDRPSSVYSFPKFESRVVGIPCTSTYPAKVYKLELAELQFYTGVTVDTSVLANRRCFISAEGKPVPPQALLGEDGKPIPPLGGIDLLKQSPDILLHGSGNWIAGKNTGPPQKADPITGEMKPDPDKQFDATGKIVSYSPDPALGK